MDASGNALGVLFTVAVVPLPASNGVGTLVKELAYALAHASISGMCLAAGTRTFSDSL